MKKSLLLLAGVLTLVNAAMAQNSLELPKKLYSGPWKAGHVQGVAVDAKQEFVYLSFTTMLVKMNMKGEVVGTVTGLLGHLGCLEFNEKDDRLYGSLEYKNDAIGRGIMKQEGVTKSLETGFYVAIFDVDKIVRKDMNAERDGVMTSVLLKTVVNDYEATVVNRNGKKLQHRHGCSGFDGISFGPAFDGSGRDMLTIAYGIYGDKERTDNDYQILLQYDTSKWAKYESPLSQDKMHHRGPSKPDGKYYVYTGNTTWGVQNLEYDKKSNNWFLACYAGKKESYSNFTLFAVNGLKKPIVRPLYGVGYEDVGPVLWFSNKGRSDRKDVEVRGWHNEIGACGMCSLGDGYFYLAESGKSKQGRTATLHLARYVGERYVAFRIVE